MAAQVTKWIAGLFQAKSPADIPLTVRAASGQMAKLFRVLSSSGAELFAIPADGAGALMYAEVTITNAQIKAMRATPPTLVAAPGAGKMLEFILGRAFLDYGSNALTETADNMAIKLGDGSGTAVSETIEATGFIDATADTSIAIQRTTSAALTKANSENKALVLHNTGDGEYGGNAGADTVLRVKLLYIVHNTGW